MVYQCWNLSIITCWASALNLITVCRGGRAGGFYVAGWAETSCVRRDAVVWRYECSTMYQTKVVQKIRTYNLCSVNFLEYRAVYEMRLKSIVEPERPQMTIWRIRVACWLPNVTNTHSEYVMFIAFQLQKLLPKSALVLHVHCRLVF